MTTGEPGLRGDCAYECPYTEQAHREFVDHEFVEVWDERLRDRHTISVLNNAVSAINKHARKMAAQRDAAYRALHEAVHAGEFRECERCRAVFALAASPPQPAPELDGNCWFCKGRFPVDALIAGYDTFEEQRLACLACNERMQGNWRPQEGDPGS